MSYVLYGDPGSGSATVELALAHLGETVEVTDVPLDHDAQRQSNYAAINPQRKLPALVTPDGDILTESAAILISLDDRHPEGCLLPADLRRRAHALRWLLFLATEIYPVVEMIDYPARFQPELEGTPTLRRDELRSHFRTIWKQRWLQVEQAAGQPWFLADEFSALDIYVSVLSRWGQVSDWREKQLLQIEKISRAVATRPALADVWQRHFP